MTQLVLVDAFTTEPFRGNPATVCLLDEPADPAWMQALAAEVNLSETAFLVAGGAGFVLRWFTPKVEVDLCGHATLASAHALWTGGHLAADRPARFDTRSGILTCRREADGAVSMDFPADPVQPVEAPAVAAALGHPGRPVWRGTWFHLVELTSADDVRKLDPDLRALAAVCPGAAVATAAGDRPGVDMVSRVFGPSVGIDEDPVTGSAHCTLAGFWGDRLGRDELVGHQVSARGGVVRMRRAGDRVVLTGSAVVVGRTELAPAARPPTA